MCVDELHKAIQERADRVEVEVDHVSRCVYLVTDSVPSRAVYLK
ncbi:hypothetical protein ACFQJ8_25920 [Halocatena marina]